MDGIDAVCVDIDSNSSFPKLEILSSLYAPFEPEFQKRLKQVPCSTLEQISLINFEYSQKVAQVILQLVANSKIAIETVDAIGSHGQTIFHNSNTDRNLCSTFQIGSPSIIAELTGITTVGNFRVRDIAAGGTGAPLVSMADYLLFGDSKEPIALNNLGSISNVTVVTPKMNDMLAFDTGPANVLIDYYANKIPNNPSGVDFNGDVSASGKVNQKLLKDWLENPFFKNAPPKAAGFEDFIPKNYSQCKLEDLVRTAVELTAISITEAYSQFILPNYPNLKKVIFSGGGIYNVTLMNRISELMPKLVVEIMDQRMADFKEAIAFAILANETLSHRPGSIPAITGVTKPVVLGEIAF